MVEGAFTLGQGLSMPIFGIDNVSVYRPEIDKATTRQHHGSQAVRPADRPRHPGPDAA